MIKKDLSWWWCFKHHRKFMAYNRSKGCDICKPKVVVRREIPKTRKTFDMLAEALEIAKASVDAWTKKLQKAKGR